MGLSAPNFLEISYQDPLIAFGKLSHLPWACFLDSASPSKNLGHYSYIAVDPFLKISSKNNSVLINNTPSQDGPFLTLRKILDIYKIKKNPNLPPFQGGLVGFFSYDLCHQIEHLPRNKDDMDFPDLKLGAYDLVIAFDLINKKSWIISNIFPSQNPQEKNKKIKKIIDLLNSNRPLPSLNNLNLNLNSTINPSEIRSNFEKSDYEQAVQKTINYIFEGDIFQANISQRFSCPINNLTPFQLYCRLRKINPAPFAAYLNYDDLANNLANNLTIVSASPERFLKLENGSIETRPIKGTRPRGQSQEEDQKLAQELEASEKDKAENTMIVDLLRNDLSKVCKNNTVKVTQLCQLETYASVHHLVSSVIGELASDKGPIDLLEAAFPGGSITGAPKIRAMEIITEIEPTARGPYCGSLGYISFNGDMDMSVIIRTYAIKNNTISFQVGGGIVADSTPEKEYQETLVKADALIKALSSNSQEHSPWFY